MRFFTTLLVMTIACHCAIQTADDTTSHTAASLAFTTITPPDTSTSPHSMDVRVSAQNGHHVFGSTPGAPGH